MVTPKVAIAGALVAGALALAGQAGSAEPPWGPEAPPFNLQVILRDVAGGPGFGHVKFRQPNGDDRIVYLETWVRDLAPNRSYLLQRAVDSTLDGVCTGAAWLTLGKGLVAQPITTDAGGTGREELFRDLAAAPLGAQSDIHFRVLDAMTGVPALASGCYRFTITQ